MIVEAIHPRKAIENPDAYGIKSEALRGEVVQSIRHSSNIASLDQVSKHDMSSQQSTTQIVTKLLKIFSTHQ